MAKKKVLIVEDNEGIRYAVSTLLGMEGITTVEAINGLEALKLLGEVRIDLILLDITMPVLNGREFLEKFQETEFKDIPLIALSARSPKELEDLDPKYTQVKKPFNADDLITVIKLKLGETNAH